MRWIRFSVISIIIFSLFALSEQISFAQSIDNPDFITVSRIRTYSDVIVTGDLLVLAEYQIRYDEVPDIDISQAYVARFLDGSTLLATANLFPFIIPDIGYDKGLFSFYFDVAPVPTTGFSVILQGNPSLFPSSTGNTASNTAIEGPFARNLLAQHVAGIASLLQLEWRKKIPDILLVERIQGTHRLTFDGEEYFSSVIPRLQDMTPNLFLASQFTPQIQEDTFTNVYTDQLRDFWQGTSFQTSIDNLANFLSTPSIIISTAILLATAGGIAFYVLQATLKPQMAILSGQLVLIIGGLVGWTPFEFVAILGVIGVLAIGYIFFYRASAS